MTIRGKLWLMIGSVVLVILAMIGSTYVRGSSILSDFLNRSAVEFTKSSAETLHQQFQNLVYVAKLSAVPMRAAYLTSEPEAREKYVAQVAEEILSGVRQDGVINVYLGLETSGRLAIASIDGPWQAPEGFDGRTRGWYKDAVRAPRGTVVFSTPFVEAASKKLVIAASIAVYGDEGELLGVAAVETELADMIGYVTGRQSLGYGSGSLVLKDGLVIIHPEEELSMKSNLLSDAQFPEPIHALARRMVAGETGYADYEFGGERRRAFFAPVNED
ncbi:MAG: hypothetical protein GX256_09335, partial [Fretibacterium sp.]|nr:hypothetical protein [Fretibacterium sp.]